MNRPTRILVLRFSAMGDVAMAASVLRAFSEQFPDVELHMVSRPAFHAFFRLIPQVHFYPLDVRGKHRGFKGLYHLFNALKKTQPEAIADLHDNLRSRILSSFFRFTGICIRRIQKDRARKKALTRRKHKQRGPLQPTVDRYAQVFRKLGYDFIVPEQGAPKPFPLSVLKEVFSGRSLPVIGISPFAQHPTKVYPPDRMETLIEQLTGKGYMILLFGGGEKEAARCQQWETRFPNTFNTIGKYSLDEELKIISNLSLMISMDSAGMHMASLMQIPCVSIWGATHPDAGFMGFGQKVEDAVQVDLYCRPCSIYGNIPCYRGDHACMHMIDVPMIMEKIENKLSDNE